MADDDINTYRKTPPESPEEWQMVWRAVDRANKSWIVTGPMSAFAEYRKAWAAVVFVVTFLMLRKGELPAVVEWLTGPIK